jgi:hypothetical protein
MVGGEKHGFEGASRMVPWSRRLSSNGETRGSCRDRRPLFGKRASCFPHHQSRLTPSPAAIPKRSRLSQNQRFSIRSHHRRDSASMGDSPTREFSAIVREPKRSTPNRAQTPSTRRTATTMTRAISSSIMTGGRWLRASGLPSITSRPFCTHAIRLAAVTFSRAGSFPSSRRRA